MGGSTAYVDLRTLTSIRVELCCFYCKRDAPAMHASLHRVCSKCIFFFGYLLHYRYWAFFFLR